MKHLLTIISCFAVLSMGAQTDYLFPWNPDANGDFNIGSADLLALLPFYNSTFSGPSELYSPEWNPDSDGDGVIDVDDLLAFLGLFGEVDLDEDNVWDSLDPCPDGPQYSFIDSILELTDSIFSNSADDWLIIVTYDTLWGETCEITGCTEQGACNFNFEATIDNGLCLIPDPGYDCSGNFMCGSQVEKGGHYYETIEIGEQCWFIENLRYLPQVWPPSSTSIDGPRAYVQNYFGYDPEEAMSTEDYTELGVLYNFSALEHWNLCPVGWGIPSNDDFITLFTELGIPVEEANNYGYIGENEGLLLKDNVTWDGNNASEFTGLRGGRVSFDGEFEHTEYAGWWWSKTMYNDFNGSSMGLMNAQDQIFHGHFSRRYGLSIRCIKD